jgi:hypothetical protein
LHALAVPDLQSGLSAAVRSTACYASNGLHLPADQREDVRKSDVPAQGHQDQRERTPRLRLEWRRILTHHDALLLVAPKDPADYEPWGNVSRWEDPTKSYPDCSHGCIWFYKLARRGKEALGTDWWSYCAMCGHWIAAHPYKMDAPFDPTARAIMRGEPVISEQEINIGIGK